MYGTDITKPEAVPGVLTEYGIKHPVLLDPTSAYRKALDIAVYPTATLLGPDGHVVWQGQPYRRQGFADACEAQIDALLGEKAAKGAGSEGEDR